MALSELGYASKFVPRTDLPRYSDGCRGLGYQDQMVRSSMRFEDMELESVDGDWTRGAHEMKDTTCADDLDSHLRLGSSPCPGCRMLGDGEESFGKRTTLRHA